MGTHGFYNIVLEKNSTAINMTESFNEGLVVEQVTIGSGNSTETFEVTAITND